MEWRRIHRALGGVDAIAVLSLLAIFTATVLVYAWLLGFGEGAFTVAMYTAVGSILLGVWASRRWSYGVFVDDDRMRITDSSGTLLFTLGDIAGVDVRPRVHKGEPARCLWVLTRDGVAVETPVVRGRRGFGAYIDERRPGLYLRESVFDAVVDELAHELPCAK